MAYVMRIEDVFSTNKIEQIKSNVRVVLEERYGNKINTCEIAFGNMVNGISLVYLGQLQEDIDNVEKLCYAQLAINYNGDFIDVFTNEKKQKFFGYETYDEKEDATFLQFRIARLHNVISSSEVISTNDFNKWEFTSDATSISEYFICDCQVYPGNVKPQTDEIRFFIESGDEELNDDAFDYYDDFSFECEEETFIDPELITKNTYLCRSWGWKKQMFEYIRLTASCYSRFIIKDLYLLLVDNLRSYISDDDFELSNPYITSDYQALFLRYGISDDDAYENRYGVYDISQKEIIIHAGEMQRTRALMISGFRRIDFNHSSILTYDFLDIMADKGIPYSKHLSGLNNPDIVSSSCLRSGHVWIRAKNKVTEYWGDQKTRTGLNAGEWYIIREGKHAGRSLCWLLANGFTNYILIMINIGYLSFDKFNHFTYPIEQKKRDAIWLELDKQQMFCHVTSMHHSLELKYPFNQHWIAKHNAIALDSWGKRPPSFEELVYDDTDYLIGLIVKRSLYVKQEVMDELKNCNTGNEDYLLRLKRVQCALDDYNEDIRDYDERMHDLEEAQWEELQEECENDGYRGAFADDPDAEWNID